jgi:DinB family protein
MSRYDFLVDTYETERIKTLSVWSQFSDDEMDFRPEPRARTPHEQMVHQCLSEDKWMKEMLGIDTNESALPSMESRLEFIKWYAKQSGNRLDQLQKKPADWYEEETKFFAVTRSKA